METEKTVKFNNLPWCSRFVVVSLLSWLPFFVSAYQLTGVVIGVSDGDTIKVLDDSKQVHSVRLMGIDAPEKAQAFGQASKQSLFDLVYMKPVSVEWGKKDKYGRTVGKVLTPEGVDVCFEQITRGLAWHYKKYSNEQPLEDRETYARAEFKAQEERLGLWLEETQVPPWLWRHSKIR